MVPMYLFQVLLNQRSAVRDSPMPSRFRKKLPTFSPKMYAPLRLPGAGFLLTLPAESGTLGLYLRNVAIGWSLFKNSTTAFGVVKSLKRASSLSS